MKFIKSIYRYPSRMFWRIYYFFFPLKGYTSWMVWADLVPNPITYYVIFKTDEELKIITSNKWYFHGMDSSKLCDDFMNLKFMGSYTENKVIYEIAKATGCINNEGFDNLERHLIDKWNIT